MRKPYILKKQEIDALLLGLTSHGPKETYVRMLEKAKEAMKKDDSMDEKFMDMYDALLKRARQIEPSNNDEVKLQAAFYTLAEMLRNIAHRVFYSYVRQGKARDFDNERFLRLVVNNQKA